jgi:hypothetical protein
MVPRVLVTWSFPVEPSFAKGANWQTEVDAKLVTKYTAQRRSVSSVNPLSDRRVRLLILSISDDSPVEALGTGLGRREPDLLVGGLLVDDICVGSEADCHDTSL